MKQLNLSSRRLAGLNPWQRKRLLRYKRSIYKFPPFDEERYSRIIEEGFENNEFLRQLREVKLKLPDYDDELIEDVVKFHIRSMAKELTKVRPWERRIYIRKWGYIRVFPFCFNPYSTYYNHSVTMKSLKKYQKEINTLKQKK